VIPQRPAREKRYGWWRKYNGFWDHPKWQVPSLFSGWRIRLIAMRHAQCDRGAP
jgi:hypothetical protein